MNEVWVLIIERKAEPRTIVSVHTSEDGAKNELKAFGDSLGKIVNHDIEKMPIHT